MIANAWFERALNYEPAQRVQFVYNTCSSFFYPQELETVWQRLLGLQQTAVNQVSNSLQQRQDHLYIHNRDGSVIRRNIK